MFDYLQKFSAAADNPAVAGGIVKNCAHHGDVAAGFPVRFFKRRDGFGTRQRSVSAEDQDIVIRVFKKFSSLHDRMSGPSCSF